MERESLNKTEEHFLPSRMTHKEVLRDFVDSTSINGLTRLFVTNKIRKFLWTIIVISTCVCFGVHFYFMLTNYLEYSVNTDSTIIDDGFDFPDVTLCAKNPYDSDKSTENRLGIHQATEFWKYLLFDLSNKKRNISEYELYAQKLAYLSFLKFANDLDIFLDIKKHIHYCTYNGKRCNKEDFSIHKLSSRMNCITFHPRNRKLNSPGVANGLRLIMDTGKGFDCLTKYGKILKTNGFEVTIQENGILPTLNQKSFLIQPGKVSDISLVLSKYEKISTPIQRCHNTKKDDNWVINLHTESSSVRNYKRDKSTCRIMKEQRQSLENCHCWRDDELIPWKNKFFPDKQKSFPLCHQIPFHFFNNSGVHENGTLSYRDKFYTLNRNNSEYVRIVRKFLCTMKTKKTSPVKSKNIEGCGHPCESVAYYSSFANYDFELDFDAFKNYYEEFYGKFRLVPVDDLSKLFKSLANGKSLTALNIYAADLHVEETVESIAYPISEFLSDFGGNLGLWIGCTVITVAEILELFMRLAYVRIKKKKMTKLAKLNGRESEPMNDLRFELK